MNQNQRKNLVMGVVLVLIGGFFLAAQFVPGLENWWEWVTQNFAWPYYIIGAGLLLLVVGLLAGTPEMAVPAAIVMGVGGLLYWQNATGQWESWAYAWTLIPGFVGVGLLLTGLLGDETRKNLREGLRLVVISAIMFTIFAALLGGWNIFGPYWPVLIILLGLWLLINPFLRTRRL
jgi:hypothetical protein